MFAVTIFQSGIVIGSPIVEADCALSAINQVEKRYMDKAFSVIMSTGKNTLISVKWTGLEFTAKRIAGK